MPFTIAVASTQPVKVDAVKSVLKDTEIKVIGTASKSGIPEQPIGDAMGQLGVKNRLSCLKHTYAVAFETTAFYSKKTDTYADVTYCALRTPIGMFWANSFPPVPIPKVASDVWLTLTESEQMSTTFGSIIAEFYEVSPNDWYKIVDGQTQTRADIMAQLFENVFSQWKREYARYPALDIKIEPFNNINEFVDISENLANQPKQLARVIELLSNRLMYNTVLLIDARGFLPAYYFLAKGIKVVMARKSGKIPRPIATKSYKKEYGADSLTIQSGRLSSKDVVWVIDDLVATGGTYNAARELIESQNAVVAGYCSLFAIENNTGLIVENIPINHLRFYSTQVKRDMSKLFNKKPFDFKSNAPLAIVPPSMEGMELKGMDRARILWDSFAFSPCPKSLLHQFEGRDVKMFVNTLNKSELYMMKFMDIMTRKDCKSFAVVAPFIDESTQDRIEYPTVDGEEFETIAMLDIFGKFIGHHKLITYDVHCEQTYGGFDNLRNEPIIKKLWHDFSTMYPDAELVFPDAGAFKRFAKALDVLKTATIYHKDRDLSGANNDLRNVELESKAAFEGKTLVICDDMMRSGGTAAEVAADLKRRGANKVYLIIAHSPLEPKAANKYQVFDGIWTSDSCSDHAPSEWVHHRITFA